MSWGLHCHFIGCVGVNCENKNFSFLRILWLFRDTLILSVFFFRSSVLSEGHDGRWMTDKDFGVRSEHCNCLVLVAILMAKGLFKSGKIIRVD